MTEEVRKILDAAIKAGKPPVPDVLQGVTKDRVRTVLGMLDRATDDMVDAVFALLDDRPSWFAKPPKGARFCDGASTAHVACHVGILQRKKDKLDREGRDYWIKPLREIGAIEAIYLDKKTRTFLPGHLVAKSSNSAYRIESDFQKILRASDVEFDLMLKDWIEGETVRERLRFQAEQIEAARKTVDTAHADLIDACCDAYAPKFLPGFEVLYVDNEDGQRVSDDEKQKLEEAGLGLELADAMPDVLLWNRQTDSVWIIEAVTSDGEVDDHKVNQVSAFAAKHGKKCVGFTTAYPTWKVAAARQGKHKNLAVGSYVWIREDASKQFLAESFPGA
ncbi:MAG: BsuBI/PstI family type II restriction endonuclease [Planctomycetota bacterium]